MSKDNYDERPSKPITKGCEVYPRHNSHSRWKVVGINDDWVTIRGGKNNAFEVHPLKMMEKYWRVRGACK